MAEKPDYIFVGAAAILGVPVLIFLLWAILAPWNGYALMVLWRWFLVPLGLPQIALWQAMGVGMIGGFLAHQTAGKSPKFWDSVALGFLKPAFALLFGWLIVTLFK